MLNNGQVASTLEIIRLIAGPRSGAGSRPGSWAKTGIQADDAGLPVRLPQALDAIADRLSADTPVEGHG